MSSRASSWMARRTKGLLRVCLHLLASFRKAWLEPAGPPFAPELRVEIDRLVAAQTEELVRRNAELSRSRVQAERALRARSDSLASLSHEIRTPVNAVIGMANVLLSTELSAKQRTLADRMLRSSESLLHLLNDFLDFSRIESGKIELERIAFCPREILEECLDLLTQVAQSKGLDLALWVDPAVPERVMGDPGRLRQILVNLINNAVKFTAQGFVSIELLASPSTGSAVPLEFRVHDSGIGIPAEKVATLFHSYVQADASMARKFGGCGLGLAISKRLCDLMGGEIVVTSQPGKGSTFALVLTLDSVAATPRCGDGYPEALRGASALLVHAESESARVLVRQLEALGCDVQHERSVRAALTHLHAGVARDFTLFDASLPGSAALSGLAGNRTARAAGRLVRLIELFGSESTARGNSRSVVELGKPIKVSELIEALAEERVPSPVRRPSSKAAARPDPGLLETRYRQRIRILVAEDEPSNQDVLKWVLSKRSFQLEVVSNGSDAVEAFRSRPHDLVLMDMRMPGMDGLAATRAIRKIERELGTRVPVLALTANVMQEDREQCLSAGMDDFITKPFRPSDLQERVEVVLWSRLGHQPAVLHGTLAPSLPPASERGALDPSVLGTLLRSTDESGWELAASLIAGFLESSPRMLDELEEGVSSGELGRVADLAHRFLATAGSVGARTLVSALRELEAACKSRNSADSRSALLHVRAELEKGVVALRVLRGGRTGSFRSGASETGEIR